MFTKINGKSYEELTHEEIVKSMTQHAFFLFMDRGRGGIEQAAHDIVTSMSQFMLAKNIGKRYSKIKTLDEFLTQDQYKNVVAMVAQDLIDTLITEGTKHFSARISQVITIIANVRG